MPYMRVGAMKISDHHVRSPLLNLANACQTCHRVAGGGAEGPGGEHPDEDVPDAQYRPRCPGRADRRCQAGPRGGATDDQLAAARGLQRKAQFLLDFVEAENSTGFHATRRRCVCSGNRSTTRARARSRSATRGRPQPARQPRASRAEPSGAGFAARCGPRMGSFVGRHHEGRRTLAMQIAW